MEKKVIIEITETGWQTKVLFNGKEYSEVHKGSSYGSAGVSGNLEKETDLPEEIIEAVTDGFYQYNVMDALRNC